MELQLMTTVVGMRFNGKTPEDVAKCGDLVLVPEPENEYDPNAVLVLAGDGVTKLGHMSREDCPRVIDAARKVGLEFPVRVVVCHVRLAAASVGVGMCFKK